MYLHRFTLLSLVLLLAAGCAGSSVGDSMQQSLQADPQLVEGTSLDAKPPSSNAAQSVPSEADAAPSTPATRPSTPPVPGDQTFVGPLPQTQPNALQPTSAATEADLTAVPADLKPYVADVLALGILSLAPTAAGTPTLAPNQPVSRGTYANWLLTANNRFFADQPNQKVRPAVAGNSPPAFQDVPPSHPDFAAVQGLAEAGLIPSTLTGNSTAVTFRPDTPLNREDLLIWKVPLDTRAALPKATVEAVKEVWGFQDAATIAPLALQAVLADHQTGEFANIVRAFGYTTLLQPQKAVTQAEAIATLWRFGSITSGISAADLRRQPAPAADPPTPQSTPNRAS